MSWVGDALKEPFEKLFKKKQKAKTDEEKLKELEEVKALIKKEEEKLKMTAPPEPKEKLPEIKPEEPKKEEPLPEAQLSESQTIEILVKNNEYFVNMINDLHQRVRLLEKLAAK